MIWQDIAIALTNVLFGYSLAYQIFRGFKEKKGFLSLQTSLLTTIGLYVLSLTYLTLNLLVSAVISSLTGTMWLLLFIQRLIYKKA